VKRRDFLVSAMAVGSAGFSVSSRVFGQVRPCPVPELRVDDTVVNTSCQSTAIENVAASLSPGQSTSLGDTGLSSDALFTIQWANRFHYDHSRGRAHLLGKNASSQGGERSHCIYDAASNKWQYAIYGGSETGHIYESFIYDPKTGTPYHGMWSTGATPLRYWTEGSRLDSWSTTSTAPWNFSSTNATNPVLGWHPNLFGEGDGGVLAIRLVSGSTVELVAWRRSNNTWSRVEGSSHSASGGSPQYGAIEYIRGAGYAIATFATGNTYIIRAGSGGRIATPERISNPPIQCRHTGTGNIGILIDDPSGGPAPYILEKGGSNRVWRYEGGQWRQRNYTHPLPAGGVTSNTNWVVASVYPLGVFWGRDNRSSSPSIIWRPSG